MILMRVGEDDSIQFSDMLPEHLVAEVGGGVHYDGGSRRLNEDAAAKPFVFFVGGGAYSAGTGNHRNTRAGAGTQESDL